MDKAVVIRTQAEAIGTNACQIIPIFFRKAFTCWKASCFISSISSLSSSSSNAVLLYYSKFRKLFYLITFNSHHVYTRHECRCFREIFLKSIKKSKAAPVFSLARFSISISGVLKDGVVGSVVIAIFRVRDKRYWRWRCRWRPLFPPHTSAGSYDA